MNLSEDNLAYVEGRKFSAGMHLKIKQEENAQGRTEFIENLVRGKSIIDIGCLDHLPLIQQKLKNNTWLHSRLTNVASECLGFDINKEGIDFVHSELGVSNIYYGDIESSEKIYSISSKHWDYAIFGEIIEHLNNPFSFLQKFVSYYGENVNKIIITVPNAFSHLNIKYIFRNKEIINSDHRYWFTPYTIWKLAFEAGLKVEKIQMCGLLTQRTIKGRIKAFLLTQFPILSEVIVVVCKKPAETMQ